MAINYFSASQIQRFRRCPQSWYNSYVLGQREPETAAQALGKEIHSEMEAFWLHGTEPTHRLAKALRHALPFEPSTVAHHVVEEATEPGGFKLSGLPLRGFVDLQVWGFDHSYTILDYKTTSGWKWAKTPEALKVDPQLNLYAAWAFFTYRELDEITLGHLTVNKQTAEVRWTPITLTRDEVREYCGGIVETLRAMIATSELAADAVTRNEDACGDFGGCAFRSSCYGAEARWAAMPIATEGTPMNQTTRAPAPTQITSSTDRAAQLAALRAKRAAAKLARPAQAPEAPTHVEPPAPFVASSAFIPPDASPDLEPEPLDVRPVSDVLPKAALDGAAARGIHTVSDLQTFLAFGGELGDIKGVGPKAVDKIAGELRTIGSLWPSARLRLRRALDVYAVSPDADAANLANVRKLRGAL